MSVVHEQMHQRTSQQQQIGQDFQHMGTVLREQKEPPAIARKPQNTQRALDRCFVSC
ncbi:MAG: hypothetical protein AWT59_3058 [Candidatus Gallionella acididurans]|uniref:Uncharacterized protein n=1 Tax=Candidatus Gallionella acididurans TaxID=1796491 RepID=A0A139BPB8_9PROT|nr:MAG: hypothetical protein AWT59_3058 [Candidatus Gallionella acididurans]